MLPKDPTVIASLAGVLAVTADWLIAGDRPRPSSRALHEGARGKYLDPATSDLPSGARAVAGDYLGRLRQCGCSEGQLRGAEALLLAGARNRTSSTRFEERSDADVCADVDAAWDLVVQILRREGIRP